MSKESLEWLANNVLVGQTDQRGKAWHWREGLQGVEPNHYAGAIPVGDVQRRLFNWEPESNPVYVEVATGDRIVIPGKQAIGRADTHQVFGVFSAGYEAHPYGEWLIGSVSNILGDTLQISSAGLLKGGAQAWVEVSVPETLHDSVTGYDFRPNLLAATSLDGSLATSFSRTVTAVVCDNTLAAALGESGQKIKIRHSKYSRLRLDDARSSLSIVHQAAEDFQDAIHELAAVTVTDRQWCKFLDEWAPIPTGTTPGELRAKGRQEKRRDTITSLWISDPMVSPWKNTGLGVVQAVNTFAHHKSSVKGGEDRRVARNLERSIAGDFERLDVNSVALLERVLA